jgi:hypothetical protein
MPSQPTHPTMMDNEAVAVALKHGLLTLRESSGINDEGQMTLVFDVDPAFAALVTKLSNAIVDAMESESSELTDFVKRAFDAGR